MNYLEEALKALPEKCALTLDRYSMFMYANEAPEDAENRERWEYKMRGYLQSLIDFEIIKEAHRHFLIDYYITQGKSIHERSIRE